MLSDEALDEIREYALHMDWDVAFGGKSKGNKHLERTVKIALSLSKGKNAREDIVVAGAWLHDIGLHLGNEGHCLNGARFVRGFLEELGLGEEDIGRITHCIEAHDGEVPARTIEGKIVHDADTLDKMGPLGFIRHAWKIANITAHSPEKLVELVRAHLPERLRRIYLSEAREKAARLDGELEDLVSDRQTLLNLTSFVAEKSRSGIATEDIVEELMHSQMLPKQTSKVLREQLSPE